MAFRSALITPRVAKLHIDALCLKGEVAHWETRAKRQQLERLLRKAERDNARAAWKAVRLIFTWHELSGTPERIEQTGQMGCPAIPGDLAPMLYHAMKAAAPRINGTVLQWTNQWLLRTLSEQTSPASQLTRLQRFLIGAEHVPIFQHLPLRVYRDLCPIKRIGGRLWLCPKLIYEQPKGWLDLRLRLAQPHKNGSKRAKEFAELYALAEAVADGKKQLPCSQIFYSTYDRKWCFALTHDLGEHPSQPHISEELPTLYLRPARRAAFLAHWQGRRALLWDDALLELGRARRRFIRARSNSSRDRKKWFHVCETLAHRWAIEVRELCEKYGVRKVVMLGGRLDAALQVCGLEEGERKKEATNFPLANLQKIFSEKLLLAGVLVITRANLRSLKRRKSNTAKQKSKKQLQEAVV